MPIEDRRPGYTFFIGVFAMVGIGAMLEPRGFAILRKLACITGFARAVSLAY